MKSMKKKEKNCNMQRRKQSLADSELKAEPRTRKKKKTDQQELKRTTRRSGNIKESVKDLEGRQKKGTQKSQSKRSTSTSDGVDVIEKSNLQSPFKKGRRSKDKQSTEMTAIKEKKDTVKPSQRKKRQSVTAQSTSPLRSKPNGDIDSGSHSPRKKRLRSTDRQSTNILSEEADVPKPSPAKKTRNSIDNSKSKNLTSAATSVGVGLNGGSAKSKTKVQTLTGSNKKSTPDGSKCKTELSNQILRKRTPRSPGNQSDKSSSLVEKVGSAKSSPSSLYDFTADSPKPDEVMSSSGKVDKKAKTMPRSKPTGEAKKHKPVSKQRRLNKHIDPSLITPKTRRCRVVLKSVDQNKPASKKIKVKADVHTQETLNKVSPVLASVSQKSKQLKASTNNQNVLQNVKKGKTKKVRPDKGPVDKPIPKMPSVSFLDTQIFSEPYEDDSAIFLSPKAVKPHVTKSRPQETPVISGILKDKRISSIDCSFDVKKIQSTSTPNPEPKADNDPIRDQDQESGEPKLSPPVFSPVKRIDTPATSDYGSMESVVTPAPEKDDREREPSPSPAFSLEDDTDTLSLNKSTEKWYKRSSSKKKLKKGRYSVSKVDQWVEKINSEMEDIENFELSIEG